MPALLSNPFFLGGLYFVFLLTACLFFAGAKRGQRREEEARRKRLIEMHDEDRWDEAA